MKKLLLSLLLANLAGCSTTLPQREIAYVERPKFSWEVWETVQLFGWHTTSSSIAIPERIKKAKLTKTSLDAVIEDEERYQKEYGGYWIPITYLLKTGGDIFWWEDESGKKGLMIKDGDSIEAWRFVYYAPY